MKLFLAAGFLLFSFSISFGQRTNIKSMVDSLPLMDADTFDCKADLYWRIIVQGKAAIPFLIDKLTDTTLTTIKHPCKRSRLNLGEVAHFALLEIADFPIFLVTRIEFDVFTRNETGQVCWSFYDFLFVNENKPRYQKSVREWYEKEKPKYKKFKITKHRQTRCQKKYGINTYYRWRA